MCYIYYVILLHIYVYSKKFNFRKVHKENWTSKNFKMLDWLLGQYFSTYLDSTYDKDEITSSEKTFGEQRKIEI